ncbi:radical SAM protein [Streptomyces sp. NPDC093109]|uniref:radical SAM protein n=1 Tax=Streptomyces sp. NPDC093109 TaxID=3154977 RepID=UPI00344E7850
MHLVDVLRARSTPGGGVMLALTRRCPLSCRHCSTNSMLSSEQHAESVFEGFVETFTPQERPDFVLMSGGEVLLRPALVERIALRARESGARSHILSGMFFARQPGIPDRLRRAIDAVDHFSASLDVFHEEEVPRAAVLRVLKQLADEGKDVSLQVVGLDEDDPYLAEVTDDIRTTLEDRVPVWVSLVGNVGRASEWLPAPGGAATPGDATGPTPVAGGPPHPAPPSPCEMAAWPLVAFDGTVVACCNQNVVDGLGGRLPAHLRLGDARTDSWRTVIERQRSRHLLRGIRAFGPTYLAERTGAEPGSCTGYCTTCFTLSADPATADAAAALMDRPGTRVLETRIAELVSGGGPEGLARRFGTHRYADLMLLGYQGPEPGSVISGEDSRCAV